MNIAIIQPVIPTYREDFYRELQKFCKVDIYVYKNCNLVQKENTEISSFNVKKINNIQIKGIVCYDPKPFLSKKYDILVLMLTLNHPITALLLMTKWLHHKKIIVWGQGISVKRYLKEEKKPDLKLLWQIKRADGVWFYMEKEYNQWKHFFPNKPMKSLNNTISSANDITNIDTRSNKNILRKKYNIKQDRILIFCARFESYYRRIDLLIQTIKQLDTNNYGFIIIGAGKNKPDFSQYGNVYDFGAVYDRTIKNELFTIADLYFQPGWVGLSIVEAMAYANPICTFARSEKTLQCVEYSYIEDGKNGFIFKNMNDCIQKITKTSIEDIHKMGENARLLVKLKLTPEKMASNAWMVLKQVYK